MIEKITAEEILALSDGTQTSYSVLFFLKDRINEITERGNNIKYNRPDSENALTAALKGSIWTDERKNNTKA